MNRLRTDIEQELRKTLSKQLEGEVRAQLKESIEGLF